MSLKQATFSAPTSLFGGLIPPAPKTYAAWPVWHDSTTKEVKFQPMKRKEAAKLLHKARKFENQSKEHGHQDGAIGRNGLAVLHAFLFDFLNHRTGQLTPTRATIARAANISIRSVDRGLAKLKESGVINWIRRCAESIEDGIYRLRQQASAYFVLAQGQWRGFWQEPPAPLPYPDAWGQTPPLPDPLTLARMAQADGASPAVQLAALECDPRDELAVSMARLFRQITVRNP